MSFLYCISWNDLTKQKMLINWHHYVVTIQVNLASRSCNCSTLARLCHTFYQNDIQSYRGRSSSLCHWQNFVLWHRTLVYWRCITFPACRTCTWICRSQWPLGSIAEGHNYLSPTLWCLVLVGVCVYISTTCCTYQVFTLWNNHLSYPVASGAHLTVAHYQPSNYSINVT